MLNQGRINAINSWGLSYDRLVIDEWSSDSQTKNNSFGTNYFSPCIPFTLDSNDYIIGYQIWWSSQIFGLEFYTLNGLNYSCYDEDSVANKYSESGLYQCDNGQFYYLTGLQARSGGLINGMQFQFKSSVDSLEPTANPTAVPTMNPTTGFVYITSHKHIFERHWR